MRESIKVNRGKIQECGLPSNCLIYLYNSQKSEKSTPNAFIVLTTKKKKKKKNIYIHEEAFKKRKTL
jgi:hypothetical protein